MEPAGFLSYVQADDLHDNGAISELRSKLAAEVRMQTGLDFLIFQDRNDILWGQQWRDRIASGIDSVTILIPILTPGFFRSTGCREEVERFLERERTFGRNDLILPIYYVTAPQMSDDRDSIGRELQTRQYFDWRPLRNRPIDSCRFELANLASQLVQRLGDIPYTSPEVASSVNSSPATDQDAPGFIELLATSEDAMPLLVATVEAIGEEMVKVTEVVNQGVAMMNRSNSGSKSAAGKLNASRFVADGLKVPAENIRQLSEDYLEQLDRVDGGMRALASQAAESTGDDRTAALALLKTLREVEGQVDEGLGAMVSFADTADELRPLSSTTRPAFSSMADSARRLADTKSTYSDWANRLAAALGLE